MAKGPVKTGQIDVLSDVKEFVDSLPSDQLQHRCGCCNKITDENGMCWQEPCMARDMAMGNFKYPDLMKGMDMRYFTHCCNNTCHLR